MKNKEFPFVYTEYSLDDEIPDDVKRLTIAAASALKTAYAPYSLFRVGVAILLENGEVVTGSNQENSAYPSGLCAERVAIFYANAKYPGIAIRALAVTASYREKAEDEPVYPCGSCRQVILESQSRQNQPIKVICSGNTRIHVIPDAASLLPLAFIGDKLEQ